jgi:hypothetical protein
MSEPRRVLGVPLRAPRRPAAPDSHPSIPSEEVGTARHLVRLRPTIDAGAWAQMLEVRDLPEDERPRAWRALARALRRADVGSAAIGLVLADLHTWGWAIEREADALWVMPPIATSAEGERAETVKDRLRAWLRAARSVQLQDPAVQAFIARMHTRRTHNGRRVSVLDLIDDGHSLTQTLAEVAKLPPSERGDALTRVVDPELHVVDGDAVCQITGLPLVDVWRYFRHTWSLEYRATPGRCLFFLIRNRARPNAPVMAIGALANATLQMRVRDEWIGWSAEALLRRVEVTPSDWPHLRASMIRTLKRAEKQIQADDLLKIAGDVDGARLEARLLALANDAKRRRDAELQDRRVRANRGEAVDPIRRLPVDDEGRVAWHQAATSALFTAKRAKTLAELLFSQRVLGAKGFAAGAARTSDEAYRAFAIAARELRKVGLASRLLELNVCGAVPPYGDLLGGKLAALAVASDDLSRAYAERYAAKVSEIASQMAGREIVRAADICVVGTTSLYGIAASQYNRLRVDVRAETGLTRAEWRDLGLTEGFGTSQFAEETVKALTDLCIERQGGRRVNNLFGEGQSPRLRQVREGLALLGVDANGLLKHSTPRRVYAIELFPGGRDRLCFNEPAAAALPSFKEIAAAWRARWLSGRVTYRPALDAVAKLGPATVRADLAAPDRAQLALFESPRAEPPPPPPKQPAGALRMRRTANPTLIQSLYRASAACADHHDAATVRLLHIETSVDEFLRRRAREGGAIFVTGNPGDGKTHLLRHLEADLKAAKVQPYLDANEEIDEDLIGRIDLALKRSGRGIALAINEGVLVELLAAAGDRPWARAARDQLLHPFVYRGEVPKADPAVAVVDLNLRNNLAENVVKHALDALLRQSGTCEGCPSATCSLARNADRLSQERAIERLVSLLDTVAKTGFHATMRDVQGFLSYLLTGGARCDELRAGAIGRWYWESAFEHGQGPLFDAVRSLDPHVLTTPLLDDLLWRRAEQANEWALTLANGSTAGESLEDRQAEFVFRKRRAFFEHLKGDAVLAASESPLDRTMAEVLQGTHSAVKRLVRLLNHFYDRDESQADLLHLWMTHRYDARPSRVAASSSAIPSSELEVLVPALRPEVAGAFPDFRPAFAILGLKSEPPANGLRIDRPLVAALLAGEQGMPAMFRRGEPEARIAAFFDRAARRAARHDDTIEVKLVDMDTGAKHRVGVDVKRRAFVRA